MKAARAKTREYLQESKALMRTFSIGDWVLRARQKRHKFEQFYDGPWAIVTLMDFYWNELNIFL